ncbi:AMP-binding protein [Desulfopila sp. IMCC35008]|uniref:AMP-binding protein n=1 Tax=Desulfopila sp. IMCC35008 TaxID=2653858 RepID=UPI0013CF6811|nr:AMP-binding protein [Desulfopila sp. IMCC35008]
MQSTYPENSAQLYRQLSEKASTKAVFADFHTRKISYSELYISIQNLTGFFRHREMFPGDRVVIISSNDIQTTILFLAALFDDLVPIVLSADTRSHRAQSIIAKVAPKLIFTDSAFENEWLWLNSFSTTFLSAPEEPGVLGSLLKFRKNHDPFFSSILEDIPPIQPRCSAQFADTAYIIFSSGTTSLPKGIVTTHENLFSHLTTIARTFSYSSQSKIFNNLSLAHADGLIQGPVLALYSGAELYRPESFTMQNLDSLLNQVYSKKVTHLIVVPTILAFMDRFLTADDYFEDDSFLSLISVAGKLDKILWQNLQTRFNVRICNMYGLSETVSGGLFCGPADETFAIGTVGKPIDVEARIIDQEGNECPTMVEGELVLRGPSVFPGYLDNHEANTKVFSGKWLHTGDIATKDKDGFFTIVGRKKAVIISGGFNIHPDEVSEVLTIHPKVEEAATAGIPDQDWGEIVISAITSSTLLDEEEIISHCRAHLESHKIPKRVVQLPGMPRGLSGKIKMLELQNMILAAIKTGDVVSEKLITLDDIYAVASKVFKVPTSELSADVFAKDIPGWDSLGHLNLITAAEQQFSVQYSVEEMMSIDSLRKLFQLTCEKTK